MAPVRPRAPLFRFGRRAPYPSTGTLGDLEFRLGGVIAPAYAEGTIGEHVIGGQLSGTLRRRRMQQEIDQLEGHYIVCGFGRVGRQVVENLQLRQMAVVVMEPDDAAYAEGEADPPRHRRPPARRVPRAPQPRAC